MNIAFARHRRRSHNRLGFAVQLALIRDLGRPLRSGEAVPAAVLETVADQLGIDPVVFDLYGRRDGHSVKAILFSIAPSATH